MARFDDIKAELAVTSGLLSVDTSTMETDFLLWQCHLCGFTYSEADGLPSEGFAPGTRWADIPASWSCPDCGYAKSDFEMVAI